MIISSSLKFEIGSDKSISTLILPLCLLHITLISCWVLPRLPKLILTSQWSIFSSSAWVSFWSCKVILNCSWQLINMSFWSLGILWPFYSLDCMAGYSIQDYPRSVITILSIRLCSTSLLLVSGIYLVRRILRDHFSHACWNVAEELALSKRPVDEHKSLSLAHYICFNCSLPSVSVVYKLAES